LSAKRGWDSDQSGARIDQLPCPEGAVKGPKRTTNGGSDLPTAPVAPLAPLHHCWRKRLRHLYFTPKGKVSSPWHVSAGRRDASAEDRAVAVRYAARGLAPLPLPCPDSHHVCADPRQCRWPRARVLNSAHNRISPPCIVLSWPRIAGSRRHVTCLPPFRQRYVFPRSPEREV
jgi:hypothetical protein